MSTANESAAARKAAERAAAKAEAHERSKPIELTFDGVDYEVERAALEDLEVQEAFEEGRPLTALKQIVGAEQYDAFKESQRDENGRAKADRLEAFIDAIGRAGGTGN